MVTGDCGILGLEPRPVAQHAVLEPRARSGLDSATILLPVAGARRALDWAPRHKRPDPADQTTLSAHVSYIVPHFNACRCVYMYMYAHRENSLAKTRIILGVFLTSFDQS